MLSELEAIAEFFKYTVYWNIAMAAVGASTASVAVLGHKIRKPCQL